MEKKVYRCSPIRWAISAFTPLMIASFLLHQGLKNRPLFPDIPGDPIAPLFFVKLPILFGMLILMVLVWSLLSNLSKQVIVTPKTLTYKATGSEFTVAWTSLRFTPPRNDRLFKYCIVSNGDKFGMIEAFYFPDFDALVTFIKQ